LQIGGVCHGRIIKPPDVIITDCVRDDGEWLAFDRHRERFVPTDIVDVVDEAQVLKNTQCIWPTAQPEGVKSNRTGAGDFFDDVAAGVIAGVLLLGSHGILGLPSLAVPGSFMTALRNLFRQFSVSFDLLTDHM
jgi:hypothetical protein